MKLMPFPTLTTARLVLRQLQAQDENEIFKLRSDNSVQEFLDRPKANNIDDARKFIEKISNGISRNQWIFWAITLKDESSLIGTICLWNFSEENNSAEIGYELLPDFQGKGIMHEAIEKIIEYGFKALSVDTIEAFMHPRNLKSIKLAETVGFGYNRKSENGVIYSLQRNKLIP